MKTTLPLRVALLAASALLAACGDVLDSPEDGLPPPVDLGHTAPSPTPTPTPLNGIPSKAQLVGTWLLTRENGAAVPTNRLITFTYFSDDTYILGGSQNTTGCDPTPATAGTFASYDGNGNGVEFAELSYSESTGQAVSGNTFIDSNGDCGLHETTAGATQDPFRFSFVNGVLQIRDVNFGDIFELQRVTRGAGVVGSWAINSSSGAAAPPILVVTLLADGRYVLLSAEAQGTLANGNQDEDPGTQAGSYSIDAANNLTVSNLLADTSGAGFGPTNFNSNEKLFVDAGGVLQYQGTDGNGPFTGSALPLPLGNRFDPALAVGTWFSDGNDNNDFRDETDPILVGLFSDSKFILGGLNADPSCSTDYSGLGIPTEPDGDGYEVGSYRLDPTTGRLKTTITSETDGSCGSLNRNRPESLIYVVAQSANRLGLLGMDRDGFDGSGDVIVRVPSSSNSLFGAWRGTSSAGTAPDDFLVAYFEDSSAGPASGFYLAVDANPGSSCSLADTGPRGGIGFGSYLFNATTGNIGYGFENDTMCQTRFNPSGPQTLTFSPGFGSYTDRQASSPPATFFYQKISTP